MNLLLKKLDSNFIYDQSYCFRACKGLLALSLFVGLFLLSGAQTLHAENSTKSISMCDDVTDGGTIAGDETGCDDPIFDPSEIISTSPATGGSNTLEYLWMSTTDDPNGTASIWNIIPGSSGATYNPGPITETTYYRRCARRVGCTIWVQESNTVVKEVNCTPPCDLEIMNIVGVNPMCNPGNTGIVALSVSGGTPPYTYQWSNGETTEDIDFLPEGTYCVTVTDANSCVVTDCVTLIAPDPITESAQVNHASCGEQNGSIDLSVLGGTAPYTYTWNNGATSQDLYNLGAGTYCVVIRDSKGCELNVCYVINATNNTSVSINPSNSHICAGETVTLTASGSGTYSWSATAGNLSSTSGQSVNYTMGMPGTYSVTVQLIDNNGCTATSSATITVNTNPTIGGTPTASSCGASNGAITSTVSGGTAPYSYIWNNGNTGANLYNLNAGQYCVTVTDANGCTSAQCFDVNEIGANPVSLSPSHTNICPGETVTLTASGSNIYSWSATAGNLSSTTGSSVNYTMGMAGTYTITVQGTDANGCISMATATVTVSNPITINGSPTSTTCGESNGAINTTVSGGTAPYSYIWNNGNTGANLYNLNAGQYCVTVTDANGCTSAQCFDVNEIGANPVSLSPSHTNICPGETVTLTASGSNTYSWSATAGNLSSTTGSSVNYTMGMAGTYTITVQGTDANGCISMATATVTVSNPITINGSPTSTTCGESNGAISTTVSGGTAPYSFNWNNGNTGANLSNLNAGQYCVTVTDENGCTSAQCFDVNEIGANPVSLSPSHTNICPGETVTLTASGSNTYSWSATAGNLSSTTGSSVNYTMGMAGTYTITVQGTDANGCMSTATATVTVNPGINDINGSTTEATCGELNGTITTSINGGTMPYIYNWNTGANTANVSNLGAGNYCVTVTDLNGCEATNCFTISEETAPSISLSPTNPTCNALGSINSIVTGGTAPYTYNWSSGQNSANITGLQAGDYCITVVDANGCVAIDCNTLTNTDDITVVGNVQQPTCNQNNGSINVSIAGGSSATYTWSTGDTGSNIQNLATGTYTVTATSALGCTSIETFILESTGTLNISLSATNPNCSNGMNGSAMLSSTYTGAGTLSFAWSNGETNSNISNLEAGTYCVTVTSSDGCIESDCITLTDPTPIVISEEIVQTVCGQDNGSITANATGGTAPYTFTYDNGMSGSQISNLGAGIYCVIVTDSNNCTAEKCFTINPSDGITATISNPNVGCDEIGSLTANPSGGLAPYTYVWNTGATSQSIDNLVVGQYCVTITDANGCETDLCTTLDLIESPVITGTPSNPTCETSNGSISVSSNVAGSTYAWSNGGTTATIQNLAAGTYTVTVSTPAGCTATESFVLINEGELSVSLDPMNPICVGADNGMVTVLSSYSGTGTLTYTWNTGATTSKISDLAADEYCVTVTSSDGCEDMACVILTAPTAVVADAIIGSAGCNMSNGNIKLNVFGGTAPYAYKWDTGATTKDIEGLAAGTYCLTICDAMGCTFTDCFTVNGGVDFTATLTVNNPVCNGDNNGSISVTTNGGTTPFGYIWNTGATTASINNLTAGNYCVTITDVFGCMNIQCAEVLEPALLDISTASTDTSCNESNGTATVSSTSALASILWSTGATSSSITNLTAGTYTVTITDQNGCTANDVVMLNTSADIEVTVSPSNSTVCPGEEVVLTSTTALSNAVSYTWTTTGGNLSNPSASITTYTMMMPGTYTITLVVENAEGCTSIDNVTVTVLDSNDPLCNPVDDTVNIGDYVWFDINNNGIQDPNELGIGGIDVKLLTAGPDGEFYTGDDIMIATVTTNASGYYLFEDVDPGEYIIMFCLDLSGTEYTTQDEGGDDMLDSDANPNTGKTDPFTVVAGQDDDLSFDAGVILSPTGCDNVTNGGEICCSQIICGAGAIPDPITDIVSPSGGTGDLEYLWMSSTVSSTFNMTTWNVIPGATGAEYQPGGITETTYITRCVRRAGCTNYLESNIIKLEVKPSAATTIESLPAYICVGETDNFNAASAGFGVTYTWDLGEGANPATATGQYLNGISWSTTGTKTITLTTSNQFCTATIIRHVEVGSCFNQANDRFITIEASPVPESTDVELMWKTNEEMIDYQFLVEHSSDGEDYKIITTMEGHDAFDGKTYTFMDHNASAGRNYYRIKHYDDTGKTEKSEIAMIVITDTEYDRFIVFPNPTADYVIFESLQLSDEEGTIMISDMKGTILEQIVIPANTKRHRIDISNYPAGNYTFFVKYDMVRSVPKIISKLRQ